MAISDTIQSMQTNISNAYTAINTKGGTVPAHKNLQNLSNAINSISSGAQPFNYPTLKTTKPKPANANTFELKQTTFTSNNFEPSGFYCFRMNGETYYSSAINGNPKLKYNVLHNEWEITSWSSSVSFYGYNVWTDGTTYYADDSTGSNKHYYYDANSDDWKTHTWSGYTGIDGQYVWTDGTNTYYSKGSTQKVLSGSTWSNKTWTGLTNFDGNYIWTDGTNIYYSQGANKQYVLDKNTSTWSLKTWTGATPSGNNIWTDGTNIYYSYSTNQYVLDKNTSTWSSITWTGLDENLSGRFVIKLGNNYWWLGGSSKGNYKFNLGTTTWTKQDQYGVTYLNGANAFCIGEYLYFDDVRVNLYTHKGEKTQITVDGEPSDYFDSTNVWTDGTTFYYSEETTQWYLDTITIENGIPTLNFLTKTWTGLTSFWGQYVWTDGTNIYYSFYEDEYGEQYVLNGSTWTEKTWNGLNEINAGNIWTDGYKIYYSYYSRLYEYEEDGETYEDYEEVHYELNTATSTWTEKSWSGIITNFNGANIWTDGTDVYCSQYITHYKLNRQTGTWARQTGGIFSNYFYGFGVWSDRNQVYTSVGTSQGGYVIFVITKPANTTHTQYK